jgi:hypothetical protein
VDVERARTLALELIGLKPDLLVASTNQVVLFGDSNCPHLGVR